MATDLFVASPDTLQAPARDGVAVTPNDGADLTNVTKALFVGGAGNLALVTQNGTTLTLTGVIAGSYLPIRVSQVKATGTTATNIAAFF